MSTSACHLSPADGRCCCCLLTTGVPVVQVPLNIRVRETSDAGAPIVSSDAGSEAAAAYRGIADRVLEKLQHGTAQKPPVISVS